MGLGFTIDSVRHKKQEKPKHRLLSPELVLGKEPGDWFLQWGGSQGGKSPDQENQ